MNKLVSFKASCGTDLVVLEVRSIHPKKLRSSGEAGRPHFGVGGWGISVLVLNMVIHGVSFQVIEGFYRFE